MAENELKEFEVENQSIEEEEASEEAILSVKRGKSESGNKYISFKATDTMPLRENGKIQKLSMAKVIFPRMEKFLGTTNQRLMGQIAYLRFRRLVKIENAILGAKSMDDINALKAEIEANRKKSPHSATV